MRVIEPKNSSSKSKSTDKRASAKIIIFSVCSLAIIAFIGIFYLSQPDTKTITSSDNETLVQMNEAIAPEDQTIDTFLSDSEFRQLYNNVRQLNTVPIENPPLISTDNAINQRIIATAEARGYKLRSEASSGLTLVDGVLLQEPAAAAWRQLKEAASVNNIQLRLTSGFRSVDDQREVFLDRLKLAGASLSSLAEGGSEQELQTALNRAAPPGYSRHHSGYAIDMLCVGTAFEQFGSSACDSWLTDNNYKNARLHGFIPSYPDETTNQGPIPEAWEYIWVGKELTMADDIQ